MSARRVLAAALVSGAAFASLGGVASAECEPFPLGSFCESNLPGPDDVPDVGSDLGCVVDPDSGTIGGC